MRGECAKFGRGIMAWAALFCTLGVKPPEAGSAQEKASGPARQENLREQVGVMLQLDNLLETCPNYEFGKRGKEGV